MKEYEKEVQKLYDNIEKIWPENNVWYDYTHKKIIDFIYKNAVIFKYNSNVLNAGSGGSVYPGINGNFFHVDISEKFISKLPNSYVASIENLPFNNELFDSAICVGSVLNYCDAAIALIEIYRVMKPGSYLILEYERSETGELIFQQNYGKSSTRQCYEYNDQTNHNIWLYSDEYINNILETIGFKVIKNKYYHIFSSLFNQIIKDEDKAGKLAKLDRFAVWPFRKILAHNRILVARKCN